MVYVFSFCIITHLLFYYDDGAVAINSNDNNDKSKDGQEVEKLRTDIQRIPMKVKELDYSVMQA